MTARAPAKRLIHSLFLSQSLKSLRKSKGKEGCAKSLNWGWGYASIQRW
jgi:hypothetical protein